MPELRVTLLVVGLIFLIGLAWWELRRSRQVRGSDLLRPLPEPLEPAAERSAEWDLPPLDLPRMSARDPEAQLPVVEVDPADFAALEARAETSAAAQASEEAEEPEVNPEAAVAPDMGGMDGLMDELSGTQAPDPPISDITEQFRESTFGDEAFEVESVTVRIIDLPATPAVVRAEPAAQEPAAQVPATEEPAEAPPEFEPRPAATTWVASDLQPQPFAEPAAESVVVDWPAPESSQVLAVRLVSANVNEKFSGRAVRMALASEGFVLGKFSIFHKPASDGRALLSIASLNKPGTFDAQSIDLQRFSGLNLFTVLPGPLSGPDAVEELLDCAQVLAQRLRGRLQDASGQPLTPTRTATLRIAAAATPP